MAKGIDKPEIIAIFTSYNNAKRKKIMNTKTTTTPKVTSLGYGDFEVTLNGERIAKGWFRRDNTGKRGATNSGKLTMTNGTEMSLKNFGYFGDVKKWIVAGGMNA